MPAKKQKTILVVDDSPSVLEVYKKALSERGFKVVTAFEDLSAKKLIDDENPVLMLLDVYLPLRDGYSFAVHLRRHKKYDRLPIILMTDYETSKQMSIKFDLKNVYYMEKHHDLDRIIKAINNIIEKGPIF